MRAAIAGTLVHLLGLDVSLGDHGVCIYQELSTPYPSIYFVLHKGTWRLEISQHRPEPVHCLDR